MHTILGNLEKVWIFYYFFLLVPPTPACILSQRKASPGPNHLQGRNHRPHKAVYADQTAPFSDHSTQPVVCETTLFSSSATERPLLSRIFEYFAFLAKTRGRASVDRLCTCPPPSSANILTRATKRRAALTIFEPNLHIQTYQQLLLASARSPAHARTHAPPYCWVIPPGGIASPFPSVASSLASLPFTSRRATILLSTSSIQPGTDRPGPQLDFQLSRHLWPPTFTGFFPRRL